MVPSKDRPARRRARGAAALRILYEDNALIVVDKPAGLLTVPLDRRAAPSVASLLETYLRPRGKRRPLVVHRIDRDTSGVVVFAKRIDAQRTLRDQFRRREPERVYAAVLHGHPEPASGVWRHQLRWDERALEQRRARVGSRDAQEAVSHYRVLERFAEASLVEVRLETGRQNQIRIQARLIGHPLVGERRYVEHGSTSGIVFPRQALHARLLRCRHPDDGRVLVFEAPVPADLEAFLARLRAGEPGGRAATAARATP